ncbi:MAG TPA: hypothetical protein VGN95_20615 [Pyrinomonadaceae bacterium]|nr:hypothetical protein [Pyrinomonadaceae bacterium]
MSLLLPSLVRSVFRFRGRRQRARQRRLLPAPVAALPGTLPASSPVALLTGSSALSTAMSTPNLAIEQALTVMLGALDDFLAPVLPPGGPPPPPTTPPSPSLSLVSVTERTVGLGNRRGTDSLGPFAVLALKGVRLEAVVRYQFWGNNPAEADTMISVLQGQLSAATAQLRAQGFLQIAAETTSLADHVAALDFWRRTADFRVLFEFRYQDADGAESLISRIPIEIVGFPKPTSVSDDMTRWDDVEAPELSVRRKNSRLSRISALTILAHLPSGFNGNGVTIESILGGTSSQQPFLTVRDFLNAFELETEIVTLGGKAYQAGRMEFPKLNIPDIILSGDQDLFRITYSTPKFNSAAVVYLRVLF